MLGLLLAFAVIGAGAMMGMDLLVYAGVIAMVVLVFFELTRPRANMGPAPAGGPRYRHKLLNEAPPPHVLDNDSAFWQTMMSAPGGSLMQGPMGKMDFALGKADPFSEMYANAKGMGPDDMMGRRVRDFLPFPNYGRQSIYEQIFIGFPLSVGSIIKKGLGK